MDKKELVRTVNILGRSFSLPVRMTERAGICFWVGLGVGMTAVLVLSIVAGRGLLWSIASMFACGLLGYYFVEVIASVGWAATIKWLVLVGLLTTSFYWFPWFYKALVGWITS